MASWKELVELPAELNSLEGTLLKSEDSLFASWKRRYFSLEGDKLYYFKHKQDLEHEGHIELRAIESVKPRESKKDGDKQLAVFIQPDRTVYLQFDSTEQCAHWLCTLKRWVAYFKEDWLATHEGDSSSVGYSSEELPPTTAPIAVATDPKARALEVLQAADSPGLETSYLDQVFDLNGKGRALSKMSTVERAQNKKIRFLESLVQSQVQTITELQKLLEEKEHKWVERERDLQAKFVEKQQKFDMIMRMKDDQFRRLRATIEERAQQRISALEEWVQSQHQREKDIRDKLVAEKASELREKEARVAALEEWVENLLAKEEARLDTAHVGDAWS